MLLAIGALSFRAARIFGSGDFAQYGGAGLGITALHEEREFSYKAGGDPDSKSSSHSETTLAAEVGVGVLALRTYDSVILVDLRYHNVSADFDDIGGDVAHGITLRLGIAR